MAVSDDPGSDRARRRAARRVVAAYHEDQLRVLLERDHAARTLEFLRETGEMPDWWALGAPRERRDSAR
jgi:hypothetical protein